jgi:hypothetical protein
LLIVFFISDHREGLTLRFQLKYSAADPKNVAKKAVVVSGEMGTNAVRARADRAKHEREIGVAAIGGNGDRQYMIREMGKEEMGTV